MAFSRARPCIGRTWTLRGDRASDSGRSRYGLRARAMESERNTIAPDVPDKPGYRVLDLLGEWQLLAGDRLTLGVSSTNPFDDDYYDHGTYGYHAGSREYIGFAAPGCEFNASSTYRF